MKNPKHVSIPAKLTASEKSLIKPKPKAIPKTQSARPTVTLEFYAPQAREVYVAGSFNGWHPSATALNASTAGKWARELALPPGQYEYLFLVDGQWIPDPKAVRCAPNPFGGQNSLLEVPTAC